MGDAQRAARAITGGLFGAILGWVAGFEAASLGLGVGAPLVRALRRAHQIQLAGGTPPRVHPGAYWHRWVTAHGFWPWDWGPVFGHPGWLTVAGGLGLITGGALAYLSARARGVPSWGGPQAAGKGQFGTAHWRSAADLARGFRRWQAPVSATKKGEPPRLKAAETIQAEAAEILARWDHAGKKGPSPTGRPTVGLLVGVDRLTDPRSGWVLERDEHALVMGSTRSGKTRRLILPTVGIIGAAATESLVLTDPKGELYDHTAAWLKARGYDIVRIDLIRPRPGGTQRYNPLAPVWDALHGAPPDPATAAKIARQVAHIITYGSAGTVANSEPIWINGQISLTAAMMLAVAEWATEPAACHLAAVYRRLLDGGADDGLGLDAWMAEFPPDHPARLAYAAYQLAQGKTRASIITTAAAGLQLWADPEVAWLTAAQDHDLTAIGQRPTAVFLVVPFEDASRYMAAGLYIAQLFRTLTDTARAHGGRLPRRVNFLLDEFGNLPPFPDFDQFVTVSAGMGIRLVLALQNLEQLKKHYERTERTIRGNLGTWLFLRTSDLQTAKELSDMIGKYTTQSESTQMPKVGWTVLSTNVGHTSQGLNLTGRELVTPDELMRWPADQVLVWQAGFAPAKLPLPDLSQWTIFQGAIDQRQPWAWPATPVPSVPMGLDDVAPVEGEGGDAMETAAILTLDDLGPLAGLFEGQLAPIDAADVPAC
jgi:type IV secretion system protein VirD4